MKTIYNSPKQLLINYIEELSGEDVSELTYEELQELVIEAGRRSVQWFGESLTFQEWAN